MAERDVFERTLQHFLEPVMDALGDETVTEVMINGPEKIYIERAGHIEKLDRRFRSQRALVAAIRNVAQYVGRRINDEAPRMDARLPDGSRVHAIIPPVACDGPYLAIRKFSKKKLKLSDLVARGALSADVQEFLGISVLLKKNVLVAGGTGSGKTTLLNCLSEVIPSDERILVLEDSSELSLWQDHAVRMESKQADKYGKGKVTIRDLLHSALRMRPDRIIVGECRGEEALDMIQALNTGHGGSMSTIHANSPREALSRLETLALFAGFELPLRALRGQIAAAIHVIVYISRFLDGTRKLCEVAEVLELDSQGDYRVQPIYEFTGEGVDEKGRIQGTHRFTGTRPSFAGEPRIQGLTGRVKLTRAVFEVDGGAPA